MVMKWLIPESSYINRMTNEALHKGELLPSPPALHSLATMLLCGGGGGVEEKEEEPLSVVTLLSTGGFKEMYDVPLFAPHTGTSLQVLADSDRSTWIVL